MPNLGHGLDLRQSPQPQINNSIELNLVLSQKPSLKVWSKIDEMMLLLLFLSLLLLLFMLLLILMMTMLLFYPRNPPFKFGQNRGNN